VNAFKYPVVQVHPTHTLVVAEHVTLGDARADAARLDFESEDPGVWHHACEPDDDTDHRRAN
jgi:hypothetical protein